MTQSEFNSRWRTEDLPFCEAGMKLLRIFAERHPAEFASLPDMHYIDVDAEAFQRVREWKALGEHFGLCAACNEP